MDKMALSIDEFGAQFGIGRSKAYQLSRTKGFPSFRVGRRVLIPVDQLKEWMEKQADQNINNGSI